MKDKIANSVAVACVLSCAIALLSSCSVLFPNTLEAIEPAGTTLDELGLAILADIEMWFDSVLYILGLGGM